jgi:hypothetical protein
MPVCAPSVGQAIREFTDACNDSKSYLSKHPGDYTFYKLGVFDEHSATFKLETAPVRLISAIEAIRVPQTSSESSCLPTV